MGSVNIIEATQNIVDGAGELSPDVEASVVSAFDAENVDVS